MAALVAAGACTRPDRPPIVAAGGAALARFDGCGSLARYLQDAAVARVGPYGLGGAYGPYYRGGGGIVPPALPSAPGAAPGDAGGGADAPPAHSGTNVQEAGVDEPDIVKNDGRRLLAVSGDRLHVVDLTASPPAVAGSVTLPGYDAQLLVQGDHVLAVTSEWGGWIGPPIRPGPVAVDPVPGRPGMVMPPYRPTVPRTRLTLIDVSDPGAPEVRHRVVVDGGYVDARLVGGRARVVLRTSTAPPLDFVMPADGSEPALRRAQAANEAVIRRTTADDWLPKVRTDDGTEGGADERPLVACDRLARPPVFSGFDTVSVLSLDLARDELDTGDTVGVTADAQTVYASTKNLYVATQATTDTTYTGRLPAPGTPVPPPTDDGGPSYEPRTDLHVFDVSAAGPAVYRASGSVDGAVLNQWSLSEHEGHLRVVTTTGNWGCGGCVGDQSQMSVLRPQGDRLVVVGTAGGMGKGEAVKAVRFLGDRAFVVTFRQIDPFYVVDLSDPTKPVVAGELKVPGYSAYLHPVGEHRVLGVGRDATDEGRVLGVKVALYDVSDADAPTEVTHTVFPEGYTSVEQTAKAFLWWEPERLAAVPVTSYGRVVDAGGQVVSTGFTGVVGFEVGRDSLGERGRVVNEPGPWGPAEIVRSAVAGDRLLTVSANGVRVSDLRTLAPRSWVPFPAS